MCFSGTISLVGIFPYFSGHQQENSKTSLTCISPVTLYMSHSPIDCLLKTTLEQCLWKALSWISSCTRKLSSKQDVNRHFWNHSNICATSNSSKSRCAVTEILPAAESYSLVGLPWQFTVAWGTAAKPALPALQQVIHQQLSPPSPKLAHAKPREGWRAEEGKHNKPS